MKNSKLRRFLVLFALVIIIQNGTIIVQNAGNDAEIGTEERVAPCSDFPGHEDVFD